ncbi:hypothetical protein SLEP1_g55703 [Rubroshorea leprosula]|uniref:Uncharacterized protein n=1 Tax=Rubroshorea leprosula TaxID=152421 RepID=A0AAV5MG45_9ROSI|nr:hypothetical protein SLEP1_g55703 [Rubroshorea leprosula]
MKVDGVMLRGSITIPLLYISFHVVLREVFMNSHMNCMGLGL